MGSIWIHPEKVTYTQYYKFKLNNIDDIFNNTAECIYKHTDYSSDDKF